MRDAKKEADERLKYLRKQKQIVEGENERLRAQLTGGRPTNAISIETAQRQSDKGIKPIVGFSDNQLFTFTHIFLGFLAGV